MRAPSDRHYIHGAIHLLANRIQAMGDKITNAISIKQWYVLLSASQMQSPSIVDIARDVGTSRQNTAKLLEQLAQKGFVNLGPCENDRRSRTVQLTPFARQEMPKIAKQGGVFVQRLLYGISDANVATARKVMEAIFVNLQEMETENQLKGEKQT